MEEKICPICGQKTLYDYEDSQLSKFIPSAESGTIICESCGYFTCDKFVPEYNHQTAKIILDLKILDKKLNRVWYPIILDLYKIGALHPIGKDTENYGWAVTPYIAIPMPQRVMFPIDKKNNLYQEYLLNHERTYSFDKNKFNEALTKFIDLLKKYND